MSVTIKDIAKAAGVSISTVSRVLSASQTVDQEKKERVMKAVRELNYIPNSNARNLRKTRTQTVMILAKTIDNPFFQKIIHNLGKVLMLGGLSIVKMAIMNPVELAVASRGKMTRSNVHSTLILLSIEISSSAPERPESAEQGSRPVRQNSLWPSEQPAVPSCRQEHPAPEPV